MKVVYIAGPYRAKTINGIYNNIQNARKTAEIVWGYNYAVLCPHMNSAFMDGLTDDKVFLEAGLELLRRSDFIVLVDGWLDSQGTIDEVRLAKELGKPVYTLDEFISMNKSVPAMPEVVVVPVSLYDRVKWFVLDLLVGTAARKSDTHRR